MHTRWVAMLYSLNTYPLHRFVAAYRLSISQPHKRAATVLSMLMVIITTSIVLTTPAFAASKQATVLVLGDSLSAAYKIPLKQGWVSLLRQQLNTNSSTQYHVVNASVSGETSAGGLARLPQLLSLHQPDIVIIELGGNDGLRGYPLKTLQQNLTTMVTLSEQAQAKVLLLGIQIPPNYGKRYTQGFKQVYPAVASKMEVALVPFFLEGVALKRELMLTDGIHPNAKAQPLLTQTVWEYLAQLL